MSRAEGTKAKGDGVSRESPRAPKGGVHAGGSHNHAWQLPHPEHETISNSTQSVSKQTNGELGKSTHMYYLFACQSTTTSGAAGNKSGW